MAAVLTLAAPAAALAQPAAPPEDPGPYEVSVWDAGLVDVGAALVPTVVASVPGAVVVWAVGAAVEPSSRVLTALLVAALATVGVVVYLVGLRVSGVGTVPLRPRRRTDDPGDAGTLDEPADPALEP